MYCYRIIPIGDCSGLTRLVMGGRAKKSGGAKNLVGRGKSGGAMNMEGNRTERVADDDLPGRKNVERVIRDVIRRLVETGLEKLIEGPESLRNFVADIKLPKEIANYLLLQIDETKNGLYRVVAKEIRGFLQQNDLGEELARALSHLSVEINTQIRFVPSDNDGGTRLGQPEVHASVQVKSDRPPPPDSSRTGA
jgi:hypothetical protein